MSNKFTVIRDTREKPEHGWNFEPDAYCAGTVRKGLKTGDYSIEGFEDQFCIERKMTLVEFVQNCSQARWDRCVKRMGEMRFAYLFFEFPDTQVNEWPQAFLNRAIADLKKKGITPDTNYHGYNKYMKVVKQKVYRTKKIGSIIETTDSPRIPPKLIWRNVMICKDHGIKTYFFADAIEAEKKAYDLMKTAYATLL